MRSSLPSLCSCFPCSSKPILGKKTRTIPSKKKPCQKIPTDPPGPARVRGVPFGAAAAILSSLGRHFGWKKAKSGAKRVFFGVKNLYLRWEGAIQELHFLTSPLVLSIQHSPSFAAFISPSKLTLFAMTERLLAGQF